MGDPEAYRIPPVILWNPLVQTQCDLACPYCQSSLRTWRWNDGTSPHSMPRSIFSVHERVLLVSCVYLCGNHHQVIAHDPELLKSVREAGIRIRFILFHKSGMTKELHNFTSSSIQAGLCIQDIESMLLICTVPITAAEPTCVILKPQCPWIVMNSVIFRFLIQREIPSEEC